MEKLWNYNDYVDRLQHPNQKVRRWALNALDRQYHRTYAKEAAGLLREEDELLFNRAVEYVVRHRAQDAVPVLLEAFHEGAHKGKAAEALGRLGYGDITAEVFDAIKSNEDYESLLGFMHFLSAIRGKETHDMMTALFSTAPKGSQIRIYIGAELLKHCRPLDVRRVLIDSATNGGEGFFNHRDARELLDCTGAVSFFRALWDSDLSLILGQDPDVETVLSEFRPCMKGVADDLKAVWPLLWTKRGQDAVSLLMFKAQDILKVRFPGKTCRDCHREVFEKDYMALAFLEFFTTNASCWDYAALAGGRVNDIMLCAALACYQSIHYRGLLLEALEPGAPLSVLLNALRIADEDFPAVIMGRICEAAPIGELIEVLTEDLETWGDIHSVILMGRIGDKAFVPHLLRILESGDYMSYLYDEALKAAERLHESAHETILQAILDNEAGDVFNAFHFLYNLPYSEAFDAAMEIWEAASENDRDAEMFSRTLAGIGDARGVEVLKKCMRDGHAVTVANNLETLAALHDQDIAEEMLLLDKAYKERMERFNSRLEAPAALDPVDHPPITYKEDGDGNNDYYDDEPVDTVKREAPKIGRNAKCPCGSGKKYKKCCMNK
ncbi:SEC-C motif domain protein [Desulfatibacillum aliphaticivorans]|uniref:SEC-C motif domain protein n=1 Tax=Desulfatibacillum aliphaticivorans TaxID=218208 RepID=B8FIS8_DESAL|nr:SEC-C metal-binding domain-containing protein [Desulfatibacillum aliphaticivorans]ACL04319.1 SEC-C motif domain protein [Desulfatibacillum aliphaticivorans]